MDQFDSMLAVARSTGGMQEYGPNAERIALQADQSLALESVVAPPGSLPAVSARAIDMIVAFEVGSATAYTSRYRHPLWPRGRSGITCGIGYDVGYVTPAALAADWRGHTSDANIDLLAQACGVTGAPAAALLPALAGIDIPFAAAMAVFSGTTLVQTSSKTVRALPNAVTLSGDSLGALVSLVYNRGASFFLAGDRYVEMRQIQGDIAASEFALVPQRIRNMKRLWQNEPDARGLLVRRDLEATLFEAGLAQR